MRVPSDSRLGSRAQITSVSPAPGAGKIWSPSKACGGLVGRMTVWPTNRSDVGAEAVNDPLAVDPSGAVGGRVGTGRVGYGERVGPVPLVQDALIDVDDLPRGPGLEEAQGVDVALIGMTIRHRGHLHQDPLPVSGGARVLQAHADLVTRD